MATTNTNKKEELERKKRLAYTLFVDNGFEQKVIAQITGISEKSISAWKKDGKWEDDKQEARMGFDQQRRRIRQHIDNLLTQIEKRKEPDNVPTASEGDVLSKLTSSAKALQTELSFAHKAEAGKGYVQFVQEVHGQQKAIETVELWHEYLMSTT